MNTKLRKLALTVAGATATIGLVMVSAPPTQALDTGWGCGGACRQAPDDHPRNNANADS